MALILDLTNCDRAGKRYAIEQGAQFDKVTLLHERDLTGWTLKGQIRTNFVGKGGELVESFDFAPIEFKSILICGNPRMRSIIKPTLTAAKTEVMGSLWISHQMVTRNSREDVIIGRNAWVYDIEVSDGTQTLRISQGLVEIDLGVTL